MIRAIVTLGGIGRAPVAPGTVASALAIALGLVIHGVGHAPLFALATALAIGVGVWAVPRALPGFDRDDPPEIVIDELAGQWLALLFPSIGFWLMGLDSWHFPYPGWVAAFVFFRLLDIWKPWIVGRADRRGDAAGVMLDDIYAGLMAGVATMVSAGAFHGVMG